MLFGGGRLLAETALLFKKSRRSFLVVTSKRHLSETFFKEGINISLLDFLNQKHIEYLECNDVNTDKRVLKKISPTTFGISIGSPWIFKKLFINRFPGKLVNLHGSRLPQDRGGGGFSWRILRKDRLGFAVIHMVDVGVDTGQIITYRDFLYPESCRISVDYEAVTIKQYLTLIEQFIKAITKRADFLPVSFPEYLSTYWPRINSNIQGFIDWSWRLKDIEQFICAFDDPYSGARTFINGTPVRLKKCHISISDGIFHPFQQGIIYRILNGIFFIAKDEGTLLVEKVIFDSKTIKINVGDRFFTPQKYLENAKQIRVQYDSHGLKTIK